LPARNDHAPTTPQPQTIIAKPLATFVGLHHLSKPTNDDRRRQQRLFFSSIEDRAPTTLFAEGIVCSISSFTRTIACYLSSLSPKSKTFAVLLLFLA